MNVVIAIDSFKGSLSSIEAGTAVKKGIHKVDKNISVKVFPVADGGEGTVESLVAGMNGHYRVISVTGPLGEKVDARYGIIDSLAVIEMAEAAGITLVPNELRNPLNTTTYGVGEIILDAISQGCRKFIIGIGGSATNDGGIGMLQELGAEFMDDCGKNIEFGAKGIETLKTIKVENMYSVLYECEFRIACDVKNPLCGDNGCSAIFGPQKGGTLSMVKDMDNWLKKYADMSSHLFNKDESSLEGAGAAGGLGYAFAQFLNGRLESGIDIVIEETGLKHYIEKADVVITGEGRIDSQTFMGKAPAGIADIAKTYNVPVIAVAGSVEKDLIIPEESGINSVFSIVNEAMSIEKAMDKKVATANLSNTIENIFRLIKKENE